MDFLGWLLLISSSVCFGLLKVILSGTCCSSSELFDVSTLLIFKGLSSSICLHCVWSECAANVAVLSSLSSKSNTPLETFS